MKKVYLVLLAVAIIAIFLGSAIFSFSYEPLDTVAEKLNLTGESIIKSPFPEYSITGLPDWLGSVLSGLIGIVTVVMIVVILFRGIKNGGSKKD